MTYFLITTEVPIQNGFARITGTINCVNGFFGVKEMKKGIIDILKKNNPEILPLGIPNILFVMQITKKQCDYYNSH